MKFNRRFVYISFFFPPLGGAEPRHNLSTVRRLYSKGFLPTIVTAPENYPYPKDMYLRSLIPKGLNVIRCHWPCDLESKVRFARRAVKLPENPLVFNGWKNLFHPAHKAVKESKPDFIYSVHGIGAAHLAALKLKKEFGLPWIAEFRDPWVHNIIAWDYMRNYSWNIWCRYQLKKTEKQLRDVLEKADLVVVESPVHREFLIEDLGVGEDKVQPLGIGYEGEYFQHVAHVPIEFQKKPVLGFLGSVYYGYEPTVMGFIGALAALEKEGHEFILVSVGAASPIFSKYAKKFGLKSFLPVGTVNLDFSLGMMRKMDFGIVFGLENDKTALGSKLWDYLNSNLAILAVVPSDSMAARIIEDGGCGYILPYENKSMVQVLRQALIDYNEGKTKKPKRDYVEQYASEKIVGKLAEKIEELL